MSTVHNITMFTDADTFTHCSFDEVRNSSEWPFTLKFGDDVVIFLSQESLANLRDEVNAAHAQAAEVSA